MATRSLDHVVVVNFGINKVKSCMKEAPSIAQVASTLRGVSVDTMPATTYLSTEFLERNYFPLHPPESIGLHHDAMDIANRSEGHNILGQEG